MRKFKGIRIVIMIIVLASFSAACKLGSNFANIQDTGSDGDTAVVEAASQQEIVPVYSIQSPVLATGDTLVDLYQKVMPGIVSIQVTTAEGEGTGSGFVYDKDGHIVTNMHVVLDAEQIVVAFPSGIKVYGEVVGEDYNSDLAVVKVDIPEDQLFPLVMGDSDLLQVGQSVVAIGNPFGLSGSMTIGIISSIGRTMDSMNSSPTGGVYTSGDIIQTDAAINPGNSGGPLLNMAGEVVGVNRAIQTMNYTTYSEPVNSGIGFSISSNIIRKVVPSLIENGIYEYPYMGISAPTDITIDMMEKFDLDTSLGVLVGEVTANSPADEAGIEPGDLIIAVDGQQVQDFGDLISYLFIHSAPGESVQFTYIRNNETNLTNIVLGSR
ncbi:MAG: trypsin-like peptidase domain-containing protein [Anaerolineales bacterium]|nr:trypsin-like peptidase domain-containing protein [Anaerolineales bacterium]